jgi:hypothetical protein
MNPTLFVARIDGYHANHLSLHTTYAGAQERLAQVGRACWRARFDYDLPAHMDANAVRLRLGDEGWRVRVDEVEVELSSKEEDAAEAAHHEAQAEDRDAERAGQPY